MRMLAHTQDLNFWLDFLRSIYHQGIRILHTSMEYNSFPLLCEVLRQLREDGITFHHMVKLAEPSFDESDFSEDRLSVKLHLYQQMLGTDCIDNVQRMWRCDLENPTRRLEKFNQVCSIIEAFFAELKTIGCANKIVCFPYTQNFADIAVTLSSLDGLAVYWNPDESRLFTTDASLCTERQTGIHPAPLLCERITCEQRLDFTFDTHLVTATVLTASQTPHIQQVLTYLHKKSEQPHKQQPNTDTPVI
jgi:hypothetical protein